MTAQAMHPRELSVRIVTGVVLVAVALAADHAGGLVFAALVLVGAALMLREWLQLFEAPVWLRLPVMIALAASLAIVAAAPTDDGLGLTAGALALATGLFSLALIAARRRWPAAHGLLYAGLPAAAHIWLRGQPQGEAMILWLFAIVWATDVFAFFAGRAIGGPRIAPAISPSKTWAGLGGGMAGAAVAAGGLALLFDWAAGAAIAAFALAGALLAVVAQAGDFFESSLKRRAGVKDSGGLLPGHGGVLDRVDGLVPVAVLAAAVLMVLR